MWDDDDILEAVRKMEAQLAALLGSEDAIEAARLLDCGEERTQRSHAANQLLGLFEGHAAIPVLRETLTAFSPKGIGVSYGPIGTQAAAIGSTRGGLEALESAGSDSSEPVTRYTDIACPSRVWQATPRISVVVRLTITPPEFSAALEALTVDNSAPVRVRLEAPGFDLLSAAEQETPILPDSDSPPLVFDLRPVQLGPTRITFDFFQQGNPVGTVSVPVEITEHAVSASQATAAKPALRLADAVQPPDLMLYISYERTAPQPALTFTLFRAGEVGRTFHPVTLTGDPRVQAQQIFDKLTVLTEQQDPTTKTVLNRTRTLPPDDIDRKLKQLGQNLWRDLIPEDLKAVYTAERAVWHDKTLLIVSDEPYIPWELLWPYGPGWQDTDPWCLTHQLTRWLRRDAQGNGHEAPPLHVPFGAMACLAPVYRGGLTDLSPLAGAQSEYQILQAFLHQHGLADKSPAAPTWAAVLDLLELGGYDWLHAAAHGSFYPEAPDADSALWLQDQRPLTPDTFVGPAIEDYIRARRPGFVFNACHAGREGWTMTQLGGWSNRLISTGAGLFLGPLWTVNDHAALTFAQTLYQQLIGGATVAEAVRASRQQARRAGDPTWLAYSVYAHPNARVAVA